MKKRQKKRKQPVRRFTLKGLVESVHQIARGSGKFSRVRDDLDRGPTQCGKKIAEEGFEAGMAAMHESRDSFIKESAQVLYHLVIGWESRRVKLPEVGAAVAALVRDDAKKKARKR